MQPLFICPNLCCLAEIENQYYLCVRVITETFDTR